MTKDLYYTIPQYFLARMAEHSAVLSVKDVSTEEFFLYNVVRARHPDITVWLSDAYRFGDMDYQNRPRELIAGDYIIIARPEAMGAVSRHLIDVANVGVGMLGEFMGALNRRDMWNYVAPTWEEKQEKKKLFEARKRRD